MSKCLFEIGGGEVAAEARPDRCDLLQRWTEPEPGNLAPQPFIVAHDANEA